MDVVGSATPIDNRTHMSIQLSAAPHKHTEVVYLCCLQTGEQVLAVLVSRTVDSLCTFLHAGLSAADELLFGGCSAGALTTYVHTEYVRARIPTSTRMAALADAMFSLHHDAYPNVSANYYTNQFTWGYSAWNSSRSMNQASAWHTPVFAGCVVAAPSVCVCCVVATLSVSICCTSTAKRTQMLTAHEPATTLQALILTNQSMRPKRCLLYTSPSPRDRG